VLLKSQAESAKRVRGVRDEIITFDLVQPFFDLLYLSRSHLLVQFLLTHGLNVVEDGLQFNGSLVDILSIVCGLGSFLRFL